MHEHDCFRPTEIATPAAFRQITNVDCSHCRPYSSALFVHPSADLPFKKSYETFEYDKVAGSVKWPLVILLCCTKSVYFIDHRITGRACAGIGLEKVFFTVQPKIYLHNTNLPTMLVYMSEVSKRLATILFSGNLRPSLHIRLCCPDGIDPQWRR